MLCDVSSFIFLQSEHHSASSVIHAQNWPSGIPTDNFGNYVLDLHLHLHLFCS